MWYAATVRSTTGRRSRFGCRSSSAVRGNGRPCASSRDSPAGGSRNRGSVTTRGSTAHRLRASGPCNSIVSNLPATMSVATSAYGSGKWTSTASPRCARTASAQSAISQSSGSPGERITRRTDHPGEPPTTHHWPSARRTATRRGGRCGPAHSGGSRCPSRPYGERPDPGRRLRARGLFRLVLSCAVDRHVVHLRGCTRTFPTGSSATSRAAGRKATSSR